MGKRDIALTFALSLLAAGCLSSPTPAYLDASQADASPPRDGALVIDAAQGAGDALVADATPADGAAPASDAGLLPTCDSAGPKRVRQIAAYTGHTCAVLTNGDVHCWGTGGWGQLGYGNLDNVGDDETPASMREVNLGGACAVQVAAGSAHTCVLLDTGGVRCWGRSSSGQLGVAPGGNVTTPPTVDVNFSGAVVVQVVAGAGHTCVRLDDGNVRCFGANDRSQLGRTPISLAGALGTNIDIGGTAVDVSAGDEHTCVRFDDGTVKCWGGNDDGALGYKGVTDTVPSTGSPALMLGGPATAMNVAGDHTCAVVNTTLMNGAVRCWGLGTPGRLGNLNTVSVGLAQHPAAIDALDFGAPATMVSAGGFHSCVLVAGKVRCWGAADGGQAGYADRRDNIGDSAEHPLRGDLTTGIEPIVQIVTGQHHTCALSDSGRVRCWGAAASGQLGHGNNTIIGDLGNPISTSPDVPVWCDNVAVSCGS